MQANSETKIGLIGPGIMGAPMGLNLIKAGFPLRVYARRPETAQELVQAGAEFYKTPQALAQHCDVIISIVSDTPDVEAILFGDQGVIHGAKPGSLVIDMSTISPVATQQMATKLAEQGIRMLDAPVSGGDIGAKAGTLTIIVGGEANDLAFALPIFEAMGKTITHIGGHGAGQTAKACNQLIISQTIIAVAEAFELAKAAGVDPAKVREALMGGFAGSKVMEVHAQRILNDSYPPGFKTKLHNKDMSIVAETIKALKLNLPGTEKAVDYMQQLIDHGCGELDSAALARIVQEKSKIS